LNFGIDVKKLCYDTHFHVFLSEVQLQQYPDDPLPFSLVLLLLQTTRGQEKSGVEVVRSPVQRQSEISVWSQDM
jgi:hypothetical protein